MAAAGDLAVNAAQTARDASGYVLVIEGAIPVGAQGHYCQGHKSAGQHDCGSSKYPIVVGTIEEGRPCIDLVDPEVPSIVIVCLPFKSFQGL